MDRLFNSGELINTPFALCNRELARFIAAGRLHCKIDKVGGIVETNRPDSKNWQYQVSLACLPCLPSLTLHYIPSVSQCVCVWNTIMTLMNF